MKKHTFSITYSLPLLFTLLFPCSFLSTIENGEEIQVKEHHAPLLPWTEDLDSALITAKNQSIPVYLFFTGSEWCVWCKKMDREIHNSDAFRQKMIGQCIFVRVELPAGSKPSKGTKKLLDLYHVSGVPTVILLSPEGKEITRFQYQQISPDAYANIVLKAAKENIHK